jgi:hypothetical protein
MDNDCADANQLTCARKAFRFKNLLDCCHKTKIFLDYITATQYISGDLTFGEFKILCCATQETQIY